MLALKWSQMGPQQKCCTVQLRNPSAETASKKHHPSTSCKKAAVKKCEPYPSKIACNFQSSAERFRPAPRLQTHTRIKEFIIFSSCFRNLKPVNFYHLESINCKSCDTASSRKKKTSFLHFLNILSWFWFHWAWRLDKPGKTKVAKNNTSLISMRCSRLHHLLHISWNRLLVLLGSLGQKSNKGWKCERSIWEKKAKKHGWKC